MCVLIFPTTFVGNISRYKKKWGRYDQKKYSGLYVKYPLFLSEFNKNSQFYRQILERYSNIKFHKKNR